jgi:hypothetical protein
MESTADSGCISQYSNTPLLHHPSTPFLLPEFNFGGFVAFNWELGTRNFELPGMGACVGKAGQGGGIGCSWVQLK